MNAIKKPTTQRLIREIVRLMSKAKTAGHPEPDAMLVCTSDGKRPSSRCLLLKGWDKQGLIFYTNNRSRKSSQIRQNPYASLSFYWQNIAFQAHIEGKVARVSDQQADAYFATRPYISQIGAWASDQSHRLSSHNELMNKVAYFKKKFPQGSKVPRPTHWIGYKVLPSRVEIWQRGDFRLHQRIVYKRSGSRWSAERVSP